ncbi:hypothetical protein GKZ28_11470 [Clostridium chromiireducens]|uniref:Uncharacterized protein n=1 Tax=Clostridium chromiireducens TaxID=225345 RepID=A0A964RMD3_9CLOT|nr:hypothetical protein [Clostridium chromiireducens]MVX64309.1 hypothetical protein [Clostridium chromiireducens]
MKKLIMLISIFLLLSFNINTTIAFAEPKEFSQGFYTMKDLNLYENNNYFVENKSLHTTGILIIIDNSSVIQQVIRLGPQSPKYPLVSLLNNYRFIIYGENIKLVLS